MTMQRTRKRRLITILLVSTATALATSLIVFALQQNMNYLFTPSQIKAGKARKQHSFRLGGIVKTGSIRHSHNTLQVFFTVVDAKAAIPVIYTGILPDLFGDQQSVIVSGHMEQQRFVANQVLTKHDATYMPRELKQAMVHTDAGEHGTCPGSRT